MTHTFLEKAWQYAISQYESIDTTKARHVYDDLINVYSGSNRVYHNIYHIENMIKSIYELLNIYSLDNENIKKAELIFAAFFHDVEFNTYNYETDILSDEHISASIAVAKLRYINMNNSSSVARIYELILLTDIHKVNLNGYCEKDMQEIFFDADISVFGFTPLLYDKYKNGIREEYSNIDNQVYITNRLEFLYQILSNKSIFNTEYMNEIYTDTAQYNITSEIKEIKELDCYLMN